MSLYSRLDRIAADVEKLNRQVNSVANAPQSQRTSVEGGSIDFNDADGNLKAIVGMQDDGGYTTNVVSGPTPPTPANFTVEVDYGKIVVHWDGSFGDALVAPTDWARAEVYAQEGQFVTPSRELARGSMVAASGGEVTVGVLKGQWTVCMAGWSQAGIMSPMSTPVTVEVPGYGDLVQETLDEAQELIDEAKAALEAGQADLAEKITDAEAALAGLQSTLDNLDETTLPALRSDLDAAEGRLSAAEGQIADAFGEIQDARSDAAADATSKADAAKSAAQSYADGLKTQIDSTIDTARTELEGDITSAQARADAAFQSAADADSKASTAKSTADQAKSDAAAAAGIANGKGKVLVQSSAPGAADRNAQTLWIDTTGGANTPKRWSGSAWVAVTDKAAVDAANAAATAQSKANEAKTAADAAQATATAAQTAASNAQSTATQALTSANTKNKVTRSTSRPPAVYDGRVDDVWFTMSSMGSGGRVLFQEMWNGTTWVSVTIDSQVIAYLDAAKITTGYLNVGALIEAGAITADKLIVGQGENLLPMTSVNAGVSTKPHVPMSPATTGLLSNPERNYKNALLYTTTSSISAFTSVARLSSGGQSGDLQFGHAFPVIGGSQYLLDGVVLRSGAEPNGQPAVRIQAVSHNSTGGWAGTFNSDSYLPSYDPSVKVSFSLTVPAAAAFVAFYLQIDKPGSVGLLNPRLVRKAGTTLIEDGAVTTGKLAANVLEVGNLKAGVAAIAEAVVQKIAASTASIQQADVKNLFVTGTSSLSNVVAERIAAETAKFIQLEVGNLVAGTGTMDTATINKLFSDVVVAGMAIATEFIGENAILTGAVTAPKITASEELWAKIGEFVKIRAEQLEADAIDGMVITGPNIRTAASGARVQLDAGGLSVYDSADDWQVRLTPDGSSFKGDLEAESLVANGAAEFKSADNLLASGAKLTLAAGVTDPTAPPIVQPYWEGVEFDYPVYGSQLPLRDVTGLAFDGTNYWTVKSSGNWGDYPNGVFGNAVRINATTGATTGFAVPFTNSNERFGVTCIGSELFWLYRSGFKAFVLVTDLNCVKLREWEYPALGYGPGNPLTYKPGIGNDGTNVVIAQCLDSGSLVWRTYNKTTGAAISYVDVNDATKSDISGIYIGPGDHGGGTFATIAKTATKALPSFTTAGVYAPERSWRMADDAREIGIVFAEGKFRTLNPSGVIREYADGGTGDGSGDWWCAYRWETDTNSDGTIDYRSKISPPARFTWPRRAQLKATGQPKPAGVEIMAGYLAKKATKPTRTDFKRNYTSYSLTRSIAYWDWYQNTGDAPADGNTYPTATPSSITSASSTFEVKGDGSGKWGPLTFNADGTIRGATAAGEAIVPINAANANRTLAVTFATGRFKTPPTVVATPVTPNPESVQVSVNNITATGFTVVARRTVAADAYVRWVATEG